MLKTLYSNNGSTNVVKSAWLKWLALDDAAQQQDYKTYRQYYDGQHEVPLSDRQKEYLSLHDIDFRENYMRLPVNVLAQRFKVIGFDCGEEPKNGEKNLGGEDGILWTWWEANRMDGKQNGAHIANIVDGDTYILVEWDSDAGMPKFHHEKAYDGDEGVKVHYRESARRVVSFASKRWRITEPDGSTKRRLNIYTPDSIEKYIVGGSMENEAQWEPFQEEGDPVWPLPWPLDFVPVVPFRHDDDGSNWGRSELEDLIPDQQALNKSVLDILDGADNTAFQIITLTGATAQDKDGNPIKLSPRQILSSLNGTWGHIPAGDIDKLRDVKKDFITAIAQKSQIPLQYFQVTGQIAAADTQQADDSNLVGRVEMYATSVGNSWEDVMHYAIAMANEFGGMGLDEKRKISTVWDTFERVDKMLVKERQAGLVEALVTAGGALPGALKFAEIPQEIQDLLLRSDYVNGITQ